MLQPQPEDRPASIRAVLEEAGPRGGSPLFKKNPEPVLSAHRASALAVGAPSDARDQTRPGLFSAKPPRLALAAVGAIVAAGAPLRVPPPPPPGGHPPPH